MGGSLLFSFTLPRRTVEGRRLNELPDVEIFREMSSASTPTSQRPWWTLPAAVVGSFRIGDRVKITRPLEMAEISHEKGMTEIFQLATVAYGFRGRPQPSPLSNIANVQIADAPTPPSNLRVLTTKKALILSWTPPTKTLTGAALSRVNGYVILMSSSGARGTFAEVGKATHPPFLYAPFKFGTPYVFRVAAVVAAGKVSAESANSTPIAALPKNTFPPAPPSILSAIYETNAVALIWQASSDPNFAGYNVYRRTRHSAFVRLNRDPLLAPVFRDDSVQPDKTYYYAVTACDHDGNESQKSQSVKVNTTHRSEG